MPRLFVILLAFSLLMTAPGSSTPSVQSIAPAQETVAPSAAVNCSTSPTVASLFNQVDLDQWEGWIRKLSGADQVTVGGKPYTIRTRHSRAMFDVNTPGGRSMAFDFVRETVLKWYNSEQIEEDVFRTEDISGIPLKNLVVTIPGTVYPQEVVVLTAHLDSRSSDIGDYWSIAPGANDNATGAATLLEAARVLQNARLQRTIRLIWFTGEEQGLEGSKAYVEDHDVSGIIGVINLDMFGYDGDNDRCFELHVGTLPASDTIGSCFTQSIETFNINLTYDYINSNYATLSSDHVPFWNKGVGAIEVLENHYDKKIIQRAGCINDYDRDPNYHQATDTVDKLNIPFGLDIARAALATAFSLANPIPLHQHYIPLLMNR